MNLQNTLNCPTGATIKSSTTTHYTVDAGTGSKAHLLNTHTHTHTHTHTAKVSVSKTTGNPHPWLTDAL